MTTESIQKIRELLEKRGFKEAKEGIFTKGEEPHLRVVDLNKTPPEICVFDGINRYTEHGVLELYELKQEIDAILNSRHDIPQTTPQTTTTQPQPKAQTNTIRKAPAELTVDTILKYIAPNATEQEAYMFLQLCKHRGLNPFLKEAYLIKYGNEPATVVVSKDAFVKKADQQPDFKGFKAGIIVKTANGEFERREGSFLLDGEQLLGGWAKVFRDGREPYYEEVSLAEYIKKDKEGKPFRSWAVMPATMIRKVALVHALREAYPQEFAGLYDQAEIGEVNDSNNH